MLHVLKMSLRVQMETAYETHGNVTTQMTVVTNRMKKAVLVRKRFLRVSQNVQTETFLILLGKSFREMQTMGMASIFKLSSSPA